MLRARTLSVYMRSLGALFYFRLKTRLNYRGSFYYYIIREILSRNFKDDIKHVIASHYVCIVSIHF